MPFLQALGLPVLPLVAFSSVCWLLVVLGLLGQTLLPRPWFIFTWPTSPLSLQLPVPRLRSSLMTLPNYICIKALHKFISTDSRDYDVNISM